MFGSRVNHHFNVGVPTPWILGDSLACLQPSGLVYSGDDGFVRGTRRPLLRGKLRSEGGIKVTGRLGVRLSGRAFVQVNGVPRKRLGDRKAILLVSASATWARCSFVPTDTMG